VICNRVNGLYRGISERSCRSSTELVGKTVGIYADWWRSVCCPPRREATCMRRAAEVRREARREQIRPSRRTCRCRKPMARKISPTGSGPAYRRGCPHQVSLDDCERVANSRKGDANIPSLALSDGRRRGAHAAPRRDRVRAPDSSGCSSPSAWRPVSARNTSSRLGSRTVSVSGSSPSSPRTRRAALRTAAPRSGVILRRCAAC
jgi:hypothetical protein